MNRLKFVFLGFMATPPQVRLTEYMQKYFDTEFWFYDYIKQTRPSWWRIPLLPNCRILPKVYFKESCRYYAHGLWSDLEKAQPDVLMFAGFLIPSNYIAYRWAKLRRKQVIVFTETFRSTKGLHGPGVLPRIIDFAYKDASAVFGCNEDATKQMRDLLPQLGDRTFSAQYPADLERYLCHPVRRPKREYVYLFANRLTDQYNPLLAIEVFSEVARVFPGSRLKMNSQGELRSECLTAISDLGIAGCVEFIADIKDWDDMARVYRESDILLFPAKFSNGNFTILEAMASGMGLVVSTKILGQGRLINHGRNGFAPEPTKQDVLSSVYRYIDNPEQFETHAEINRVLVRPLGLEGTAELWANLIQDHVQTRLQRQHSSVGAARSDN